MNCFFLFGLLVINIVGKFVGDNIYKVVVLFIVYKVVYDFDDFYL